MLFRSTHTVTINDDDQLTVSFVADTNVNEADTNHNVGVTVTFTGSIERNVVLPISLAAGSTATVTDDYTRPATLTIPQATTSGSTVNYVVAVKQDTVIEGAETVNLTFGTLPGTAQAGADTAHTVTINDDDQLTVSFVADTNVNEADTNHNVGVTVTFTGLTLATDVVLPISLAAGSTATVTDD